MLSKLIQLLLASTSIFPVFLILWFKSFSKQWNIKEGILYLIITIILFIIFYLIIKLAKTKLEKLPLKITKISNNKNILPFIIMCIIPLFDIKIPIILFVSFFIIITNIYCFNPFFILLGYNHYKITIKNGNSFILLTKKTLVNTNQIKEVIQLNNYIIIDIEK